MGRNITLLKLSGNGLGDTEEGLGCVPCPALSWRTVLCGVADCPYSGHKSFEVRSRIVQSGLRLVM